MATSKFCKFNARFRKATNRVAETMGLEFISTPLQVENGTLCFYDPETDTCYSLHESGYIRRHVRTDNKMVKYDWQTYQLNRTELNRYSVSRILASPDTQLGIFVRAILNYRKVL